MKCLIITDLNNSVPINLSYFEVFVQHLIVYRDQLCQMGFKPKYGCGLSFPLTCTILIIIIQLCNSNLHIGELGFKLSQREVYNMLDKPLIEKGSEQHTV